MWYYEVNEYTNRAIDTESVSQKYAVSSNWHNSNNKNQQIVIIL